MNKLVTILTSFAVVAGVFGVMQAQPVKAASAARCKQTLVDSAGNHAIKISPNGKTASVTIIVENIDKCVNKYASLSSWKVPGQNSPIVHPFNNQTFYAHTAKRLVNGRQKMTVAVPQCFYQIDLFSTRQLKPARPAAGAPNSSFFGPNDFIANFKLGGNKSCTPPAPVKKPTCSISVSKTQVNPGDKVTLSWASQNSVGGNISGIGQVASKGSKEMTINTSTKFVATFVNSKGEKATCDTTVTVIVNGKPVPPTIPATTASAPTSLPNTGAGSVVVAATGLTATLSGVARYFFLKRKFLV